MILIADNVAQSLKTTSGMFHVYEWVLLSDGVITVVLPKLTVGVVDAPEPTNEVNKNGGSVV